jgi:hypothetical protein
MKFMEYYFDCIQAEIDDATNQHVKLIEGVRYTTALPHPSEEYDEKIGYLVKISRHKPVFIGR